MHLATALSVVLGGVLAIGAVVPDDWHRGGGQGQGHDTCVDNDLLRFLRSHRRDAIPFCRQFLGHDIKTVVVTKTTTQTYTTLTTTTKTATTTSTSTKTDRATVTVVSTSVPIVNLVQGRAAATGLAAQLHGYSPQDISSACSCLKDCGNKKPAQKTTTSTTTTTKKVTQTQTTTAKTTTTVNKTATTIATTTTTQIVIPTYPTRPFRLYWLDSSTNTRQYFGRRDWVQGDIVVSDPSAALAETFIVDANQHLFYANGFGTGTPVFAIYGPNYFDDNLAKVVYFNTPAYIAANGFLYHEWTVDLTTLSITLTNPARRLQRCNRAFNNILMVGTVVDTGCTAVNLFMEYVI